MGSIGRPKLLQKDGHHRHDGYDRWHPLDQVHRPDLHMDLQKSEDSEEPAVVASSGPATEIYNLVLALEKMEYGKALLFELQDTISAILKVKQMQREKRDTQEIKNEQSALGNDDTEDREPNTYGLP